MLIAAPLFQTIRDEGRLALPYARLHRHAWTDAVIGAASLAFTGITFLLAWLIATLFDVIGIDAIKDLLQEGMVRLDAGRLRLRRRPSACCANAMRWSPPCRSW